MWAASGGGGSGCLMGETPLSCPPSPLGGIRQGSGGRVGVRGVAGLCALTEGANHPLRSSPPSPAGPQIEPLRGLGARGCLPLDPFLPCKVSWWSGVNPLAYQVPSKSVSLQPAAAVCRALHVSPTLEDPDSSQMGPFP